MELDLAVRGGHILDGTGGPARRADVGVVGDRVAAVGDLRGASIGREIRADGRYVTPGFVDPHAHVEIALLDDGVARPKLGQGVTVEILGQDGLSYAPLPSRRLTQQIDYLATLNGRPRSPATWRTWPEFLDRLDGRIAQHAAFLVPYGAVRLAVAGWRPRPLSSDAIRRATSLVEDGLRAGAVGIATGLDYAPQSAASTTELDALGSIATGAGVPLVAHVRGAALGVPGGVAEMLDVASRTGASVHISHLRDAAAVPAIDRALDAGLDVTFDVYPYLVSSTMLLAYLPTWMLAGGPAGIRRRLADPRLRPRLERSLARSLAADAPGMLLANLGRGRHETYLGRPLTDAIAGLGPGIADAVAELLLANDLEVGYVGAATDDVTEESLAAVLSHPASMVGTDAILVGQRPHPRGWGAFPRFLGRYVRDRALVPWPDAIRRVSGAAAHRFGLAGLGRIAVGGTADLVVLDPAVVEDGATFETPRLPPRGIETVVVGGVPVIERGHFSHVRPGRIILRADVRASAAPDAGRAADSSGS